MSTNRADDDEKGGACEDRDVQGRQIGVWVALAVRCMCVHMPVVVDACVGFRQERRRIQCLGDDVSSKARPDVAHEMGMDLKQLICPTPPPPPPFLHKLHDKPSMSAKEPLLSSSSGTWPDQGGREGGREGGRGRKALI